MYLKESRGGKMLKIEGMSAGYSKKEVLHNINLQVGENEIVAIVGQSGCGKSTLLKTINRIIEEENGYYKGSIKYKGEEIKSINKEELRRRIGMVFQNPIAFPISIYKNLSYVLNYHGIEDKKNMDNAVKELLEKVRLYDEVKDKLNKKAERLSGGQKQRLAIARCLCVNPDIILLDEPCSALDLKNTISIEDMLLDLKSKYSLLVVTHNLAQARRIADKVVFMDNGEIIEQSDKDKFFTKPDSVLAQELIKYL